MIHHLQKGSQLYLTRPGMRRSPVESLTPQPMLNPTLSIDNSNLPPLANLSP
ncbi:unnamed protein product [Linum tenue]|uniref:Uncharacterized protein n=1 Tax=Linum tenue TaxID=586396 RepID=A0AAV0LCT5_9ROSI|nr:unnamed protein product [Linum tenue]